MVHDLIRRKHKAVFKRKLEKIYRSRNAMEMAVRVDGRIEMLSKDRYGLTHYVIYDHKKVVAV